MKVKYLFLSLFAALAMTACSDDKDSPVSEGENGGNNYQYAYVQFGMPQSASTRVPAGDEEKTDDKEIDMKINNASFFFFNGNSQVADPCYVDPIKDEKVENDENKDLVTEAMIIMKNPTKMPDEIFVVLNLKDEEYKNVKSTWNKLNKENFIKKSVDAVSQANESKSIMMTNSVYYDAAKNLVQGKPVTADDFKANKDEAKKNPIKIQVDRVLCGISVTTVDADGEPDDNFFDNKFDLQDGLGKDEKGKIILNGEAKEVKLEFHDYWIHNSLTKSFLVKQLKKDGYSWDWVNNLMGKRSYWAEAAASGDFGVDGASYTKSSWSGNNTESNENTKSNDNTESNENAKSNGHFKFAVTNYIHENTDLKNTPKLVIGAQFKVSGAEDYVDIYRYGTYYYTKENLLAELTKNTAIAKYYIKKEGENKYISLTTNEVGWTEVTPSDENDLKQYEVSFTPTLIKENVEKVYEYKEGEFKKVDNLDEVDLTDAKTKVWKWNNGKCYYHIDIVHQGKYEYDENGKLSEDAVLGLVRNHMYKFKITSLVGLGTPIADEGQIIDNPETPEDCRTHLAAKIIVNSWKEVEHDVVVK